MDNVSSGPDLSKHFNAPLTFTRVDSPEQSEEERIREITKRNGLEPAQQKYVSALVAGNSDNSARRLACTAADGEIVKRPKNFFHSARVHNAISDMMDEVGLTTRHRLGRLAWVINCPDPKACIAGLKESFRLADEYPTETKAVVHTTLSEFRELKEEHDRLQEELVRMDQQPAGAIPAVAHVEPLGLAPRT